MQRFSFEIIFLRTHTRGEKTLWTTLDSHSTLYFITRSLGARKKCELSKSKAIRNKQMILTRERNHPRLLLEDSMELENLSMP